MFRVPSISGLFKWRQFEPEVILLAVGRYLRFSLSYRDVEELLAERGLHADHVTVWRWVQRYAPEMERLCRQSRISARPGKLELPLGREWHVDVQDSQGLNVSLEERVRRKLILAGILPKFSDLSQGAIGEAIEAAGAGQFGRLHKEAPDDSSI